MQNTSRKRGRPMKSIQNTSYTPSLIDFSNISKLNKLEINAKMMETMKIGIPSMDKIFSHEEGIPCATNIMCIGDPGVGKTTLLLDVLSAIQNKGRKCLFISAEMGKKQMYKYTERFKQFGVIQTLFTHDYLQHNTKDVIEQVLSIGWDLVLIDSIAEVIDGVRDDNGWDRKMAESWLVDICVKNNNGENKENKYTSFLLIQQVTKDGTFLGSNKLKHLTDSMAEMRRESERDGGGTYITLTKNRNGMVDVKLYFQLTNNSIIYGNITANERND